MDVDITSGDVFPEGTYHVAQCVKDQESPENCINFCIYVTAGKILRASNSPAMRGSLPPGHYFSRSPAKHVKSPALMKTIPPSM